jgi:hypothetical protein
VFSTAVQLMLSLHRGSISRDPAVLSQSSSVLPSGGSYRSKSGVESCVVRNLPPDSAGVR